MPVHELTRNPGCTQTCMTHDYCVSITDKINSMSKRGPDKVLEYIEKMNVKLCKENKQDCANHLTRYAKELFPNSNIAKEPDNRFAIFGYENMRAGEFADARDNFYKAAKSVLEPKAYYKFMSLAFIANEMEYCQIVTKIGPDAILDKKRASGKAELDENVMHRDKVLMAIKSGIEGRGNPAILAALETIDEISKITVSSIGNPNRDILEYIFWAYEEMAIANFVDGFENSLFDSIETFASASSKLGEHGKSSLLLQYGFALALKLDSPRKIDIMDKCLIEIQAQARSNVDEAGNTVNDRFLQGAIEMMKALRNEHSTKTSE